MATQADGPGPATDGGATAYPDRMGRLVQAFGRRNVAYLCGVALAVATVPVLDSLDRASGALGPDRLGGGEVGSFALWALGSLLFFGLNALQVLGFLVRRATTGTAGGGKGVSHAAIGCALPFAVFLAGMVGVGAHDSLTARPAPVRTELAAPATVGGIDFPAGSVVWTEGASPGRLLWGRAAAPVRIGDLVVDGDFELLRDGPDRVWMGRLATAQPVDAVPCGPGAFSRRDGAVECTLAGPVVIEGATLAPSHKARVVPGRGGAPARSGTGVLAGPARIGGADCAPGEVQIGDGTVKCILAHDQDIGGFPLMGGTEVSLFRGLHGSTAVSGAMVLARPLEVLGVTLPRGTVTVWLSPTRLEDLQEVGLLDGASIRFITPADAVVPVRDGAVHGQMDIKLERNRIEVGDAYQGKQGVFLLDGRRLRWARFDQKAGTWQVRDADG